MTDEAWPTKEDIEQAHERIRPFIHRTPVMTSRYIDSLTGSHLFKEGIEGIRGEE